MNIDYEKLGEVAVDAYVGCNTDSHKYSNDWNRVARAVIRESGLLEEVRDLDGGLKELARLFNIRTEELRADRAKIAELQAEVKRLEREVAVGNLAVELAYPVEEAHIQLILELREKVAKLEKAVTYLHPENAPKDCFPVVIYCATKADAEELVAAAQAANPNLTEHAALPPIKAGGE